MTNGGSKINVLIQFPSAPSPTTRILLALNIGALASSYAAAGVTDFSQANVQLLVANATPSVLAASSTGLAPTASRRTGAIAAA